MNTGTTTYNLITIPDEFTFNYLHTIIKMKEAINNELAGNLDYDGGVYSEEERRRVMDYLFDRSINIVKDYLKRKEVTEPEN